MVGVGRALLGPPSAASKDDQPAQGQATRAAFVWEGGQQRLAATRVDHCQLARIGRGWPGEGADVM